MAAILSPPEYVNHTGYKRSLKPNSLFYSPTKQHLSAHQTHLIILIPIMIKIIQIKDYNNTIMETKWHAEPPTDKSLI